MNVINTKKNPKIAIVGMACRYPDADTPDDLFINSLAQRRSFRNFPKNRLSEHYFDETATHPDKTYVKKGAFLKNFVFNRHDFKVPLPSYENTDLTH